MKKRILITSIIFSLIICLSSCIFLDKPNPEDVSTQILNYGEGSAKILSEHNDENVPSGKRFTTDYKLGITETNDTIRIFKGAQFGIEYIIESPKNRLIEIKTVWSYPNSMTNKDGIVFSKSEYLIDKLTNEYTYSSYELIENFEMQEGEWMLELFYEEKSILKKIFILILEN